MPLLTGHIIGTWIKDNGQPSSGTVMFTRSARAVDSATHVIIEPDPVTIRLDNAGSVALDVIATDIVTLNPSGMTYQVVEKIDGLTTAPYDITVAAGTVVDLSTVVPVSSGATGVSYATQAGLDAHISNPSGAHAASAISFSAIGLTGMAGIADTQAALAYLYNQIQAGSGSTTWTFSGAATLTTSKARCSFRGSRTLTGLEIDSGDAPVGAPLTVDLLKNGTTSVFDGSHLPPSISSGGHHGEVAVFAIPAMADDDFVIPSIISIGSTTAGGNDLTVKLYWS